ncbi:MAG: GrpB family protein [Gaiellaceae bacterium]
MPAFATSESFAEEAAAAFAQHETRIRERLGSVEIRHRGGTSVPGVLTAGDVDIHVRVEAESFGAARDVLSELYEPMHVHVWHSEGAFFAAPGSQPRVEVALTVVGTIDDLHHGEAWDRIAADPALIDRYNALKREHEGAAPGDYDLAKRAFFYENFRLG